MRIAELAADATLYRIRRRYHGDMPVAVLDAARWYLRHPSTFEYQFAVFLQRNRELAGHHRVHSDGAGVPCLLLNTSTLHTTAYDRLVTVAAAVRPALADEVNARTLRECVEAAVAGLAPAPEHLRATEPSGNPGMYSVALIQPGQVKNVWLYPPTGGRVFPADDPDVIPIRRGIVDLDAL